MEKIILIVVLLTFVAAGDVLAARMEKQEILGQTIARVYDERNHYAGATIYDESGKKVEDCNDELCVARHVQQRRLKVMSDPNISEGEQRALGLEYQNTAGKMRQSEASTRDLMKSI